MAVLSRGFCRRSYPHLNKEKGVNNDRGVKSMTRRGVFLLFLPAKITLPLGDGAFLTSAAFVLLCLCVHLS